MGCKNLLGVHVSGATRPDGTARPTVYKCAALGHCTLQQSDMKLVNGSPMPFCHQECSGFVELDLPIPRQKSQLAYLTGSNRPGERQMIEALIRSARAAGVPEDFHVFHTEDCVGAINHRIDRSFQWKNHMGKIDLLLQMEDVDAEYVCWLDTDSYFVRDPGDLSNLIRANPCWILMEGEILKSVHGDWWEMRTKESPTVAEIMRAMGCRHKTLWSTNGGMWIVKRDFIREFHKQIFNVYDELRRRGFPRMSDEPPLAIIGQTIVPDPWNNTFEAAKDTWAIEWNGAWRDRGKLPDGSPWPYKDWMTQQDFGMVNPAICHLMRAKHLMTSQQEPVGADWLTCKYRGKAIGEKINCQCGVDKEIYRCLRKGLCLKRLPPTKTKESFGQQLEAVTVCSGCDGWKA